MKKPYHPRTRVDFAATAPFIRAFPEEAVLQHANFLEPTNPPDNSSKLEEVRKAAEQVMASKEPLGPPNFVITTAPGNSLAPAPLQLKAEAPATEPPKRVEEPPAATPRFVVPAAPPVSYVRPAATHGVTSLPPHKTVQRAVDPAPQLETEHIVIIIGFGVVLGLGYWLYSRWGSAGSAAEVACELPSGATST